MISQSEPPPLRGPSSVVSARSASRPHVSSRSKRYNRSHTGGSSYVPQNEFPVFSNSGDVEIIIKAGGKENRYLLHRHTLTRCSGFFEASTSQEWSKASLLPPADASSRELARIGEDSASSSGNEVARSRINSPAPRKRWRYELDPGSDGDDIPMLIQKEAATTTDSAPSGSLFGSGGSISNTTTTRRVSHSHTHSTSSFFRSVANLSMVPSKADQDVPLSQADADLLRDYDNLFRIFYNYPPLLDSINIADAYVQCKSLLTLADQYDALAVVGPRVDHHLLQFQSRLWKQIAKYPISYLRLGYLSRSKVIFQEALIHVVGQWPAGERSIRQSFPDIVLDIIEDKVDELEETVSRIEGRLFRLNLTNSRGERITPGTSYLDWLAVSFFRQWLADNTSPAPLAPPSARGHSSRDGGPSSRSAAVIASAPMAPNLASLGRTYRTLGSATGAGYLGHDECKRFLKLTPELYSRDNLRRFEKRIDELKSAAREIVRPLMGSGLELEMERGAVTPNSGGVGGSSNVPIAASGMTSYLTCVRVMERDLPWAVDD
ncbi:uncharacterized protein F4812DRAFT_205250 [Daldinia caldariorum]|uniref:uncharacterized protein n=1 Tax=Daldinia caldariorum TaxID=326644 RepID=UPI00200881B6|nr:uncharacterized protein F4812DRAFT_205250 [Daldinia caldariorum]KAI1472112.1 hypothetical protein F4812DRAFT_205250 [Daldinia caldariorum]